MFELKIVLLKETTEGFQQQEELTKKDDLYNHLHESEKGGVRSNTYMYDHPVFVTSQQDGYGMVSIDRKIDNNYCEVNPILST